MHKSTNVNGA